MFDGYEIEQIRLLPMSQDEENGFAAEEAARDFLENELSEDGIYYYGKRGLDIQDEDALILFQYRGAIIGYGVYMSRNYEDGYYRFYPDSVRNVERISPVEFRAVYPDFTRFGQGMTNIPVRYLEPISILLKIKQAVYEEG